MNNVGEIVSIVRPVGDGILWFLWMLSQCVTWPVAALVIAIFFRRQLVRLVDRVIELGPSGLRFVEARELGEGIAPPADTTEARDSASVPLLEPKPAAALPNRMVADAFVLRGPDNLPSAVLTLDENKLPFLAFFDNVKKKVPLYLTLLPTGRPQVSIVGDDCCLTIGITDDDSPYIGIFGHEEKLRATLRTLPDGGGAGLALFSQDGELKTSLHVDASGQPVLFQSQETPSKAGK